MFAVNSSPQCEYNFNNWPVYMLKNCNQLHTCKITLSEQQIYTRTKGVFYINCAFGLLVLTRTWWRSYWVDTGTRLSRSTSLQGPLFLSWFGPLAEGRTLLIVPSWLKGHLVSLFLVYVFSWTSLSCLSAVGGWTWCPNVHLILMSVF